MSDSNKKRPPVVTVMGHVNHGKTTLLDYIRDAKVVDSEEGGITQESGAYQVEQDGEKITFIDTPGHRAFSQIRERGSLVADIAILVIAIDDGVQAQTKEALRFIREQEIPYIVAINKIDKGEDNIEKLQQQLGEEDVFLEDWGGEIPSVKISAEEGKNIDELLEMISLVAEMEELEYNPESDAEGIILNSFVDSERGKGATLLLKEGVLEKDEWLATPSSAIEFKSLLDSQGKGIEKAEASSPVVVFGVPDVLEGGVKFKASSEKQKAKEYSNKLEKEEEEKEEEEGMRFFDSSKTLSVSIKAAQEESLAAIKKEINALDLPEGYYIDIIAEGIGGIGTNDVNVAASSEGVIVGFQVDVAQGASRVAKRTGVELKTFDVIYNLIDFIKSELQEMIPSEIEREDLGVFKVLKLFSDSKKGQVVGGRILKGEVQNNAMVEVERDKEVIGEGRISQLKKEKEDVDQIGSGEEAGILFEPTDFNGKVKKGDRLLCYIEKEVPVEL